MLYANKRFSTARCHWSVLLRESQACGERAWGWKGPCCYQNCQSNTRTVSGPPWREGSFRTGFQGMGRMREERPRKGEVKCEACTFYFHFFFFFFLAGWRKQSVEGGRAGTGLPHPGGIENLSLVQPQQPSLWFQDCYQMARNERWGRMSEG